MEPYLPIRILIADDSPFVRAGLRALLERQRDMDVVGEAVNGQQAIDTFRLYLPDVTLMDVRMPLMNGFEATQRICEEFPSAVILILTTYLDETEVAAVQQSGARAYLFKDVPGKELISVIRTLGQDRSPRHEPSRELSPSPRT